MNTLKTLVVLTVLVMVGYGLYLGLNNGFQFENTQTETPAWLQQEMQNGNQLPSVGPPQVTPPQVTSPPLSQFSARPGSIAGAATNNASSKLVAPVPTAMTPPANPSNQATEGSVPRARYPIRAENQAPSFTSEQTSIPETQTTAAVSSGPRPNQSSGPVAIAPRRPAPSNQQGLTAPVGSTSTPPPVADLSSSGASGVQFPAAVGSVPEIAIENKLNLSQDLAFSTAIKSAKMQLQQGQLATALLTLSIWYEDPRLNVSQQSELTQLLDQVAGSVIYSREHLIEPAYMVKQGDTLEQIAKSHRVTPGLLVKINGIDNPNALSPGDQLKVVRGPFNATVNGEKNELTLWLGGRYAGRFQLAMGPEFQSIVGPFVVHSKTKMHPQRGNQPWIQLTPGYDASNSPPPSDPQIGIAGMQQPETTAQGSSPGQIGVSLKDADDLLDILSQGSKVTIQR